MRSLPDLDNTAAMIARGRHSALMSARNDACSDLRDECTRAQSADVGELGEIADRIDPILKRLREVAGLWNGLDDREAVKARILERSPVIAASMP